MKKNLLKSVTTILFFIITVYSFAQGESSKDLEEVNALAVKMFEDTNKRDFDALIDVSHPKLFEIVSKEQMKNVLKMTLEGNEDYSINIPKLEPKYKLSKIFYSEKDSVKYAFISYDMNMNMTFNKQEFDEEGKKMMKMVMKGKGMDAKFVSNNSVDILKKNSITIALNGKETDNKWVIINYQADTPLMYQLLPSIILESAKEHSQQLMLERKKETEKIESTQKN